MARPNFITRLWRAIVPPTPTPPGEQRPLALQIATSIRPHNYDLEIVEIPIRDAGHGKALIELWQYCPEVAEAIDILVGDTFSSRNGRLLGFTIADDLADRIPTPQDLEAKPTLVDPQVKQILTDLMDRLNLEEIRQAAERMLMYGDGFCTFSIDPQQMQVGRLMTLPTWELFRQEDDHGRLLGFEQRRDLTARFESAANPQTIALSPVTTLHFRYRRYFLYGRSLFNESLADWNKLKDAIWDLTKAARAVGVNPNIHEMPDGADAEYLKAYRTDYESEQQDGIITDVFQLKGGDVRKLANNNPDLKTLVENVLMWRARIVMKSRVPMWYFPGLDVARFRDVSGQNQLGYERQIEDIRATLEHTLKWLCQVELILKGVPPERRKFRFEWPRLDSNVYNQVMQQKSPTTPNKPTQETEAP